MHAQGALDSSCRYVRIRNVVAGAVLAILLMAVRARIRGVTDTARRNHLMESLGRMAQFLESVPPGRDAYVHAIAPPEPESKDYTATAILNHLPATPGYKHPYIPVLASVAAPLVKAAVVRNEHVVGGFSSWYIPGVLCKLGDRRNDLPFVFAQAVLVTTSGKWEFADAVQRARCPVIVFSQSRRRNAITSFV
jgi:hypothetical protein